MTTHHGDCCGVAGAPASPVLQQSPYRQTCLSLDPGAVSWLHKLKSAHLHCGDNTADVRPHDRR